MRGNDVIYVKTASCAMRIDERFMLSLMDTVAKLCWATGPHNAAQEQNQLLQRCLFLDIYQ